MSTRSQSAAASTMARVPLVVVRTSVSAAGSRNSCGEFPRSKPSTCGLPLSGEDGVSDLVAERDRLLDLGAAENALVARLERLHDRRARPEDVDDDPGRDPGRVGRCKGDVHAHGP